MVIGAPRTGTHFLASAVQPPLRSGHEAEGNQVVARAALLRSGALGVGEVEEFIRARRHVLALDADVSHLNGLLIKHWPGADPAARFLLTVRPPLQWLNAYLDNFFTVFERVRRPTQGGYRPWYRIADNLRFGGIEAANPRFEAPLTGEGLFPLDAYLLFWRRLIEDARRFVSPDRLLILRTDELAAELPRVADSLGWPEGSLSAQGAHRDPAPKRWRTLQRLDPGYLRERMQMCLAGFDWPAVHTSPDEARESM